MLGSNMSTDEHQDEGNDGTSRIRWGCLAGVAIAVAVVAVVVIAVNQNDDTITVALKAAAETDGRGNVYITNNDDEPWLSAKLELNGTYRHFMDSFPSNKQLKIPLHEFILDDGTRFNYQATKALELSITACVYTPGVGADILCPDDFAWGSTLLVWD